VRGRTVWQWNDLVKTFTATANRSCTAAAPLPSCEAQEAQDAASVSDLRDRLEQCFFASPDCFRPDTPPDVRRATIQMSLDAVGVHVLALVHRVLLNGNSGPEAVKPSSLNPSPNPRTFGVVRCPPPPLT
jgi:hypothetical protein